MVQRFFLGVFLGSVVFLSGCKEDENVANLKLVNAFVGSDQLDVSGVINANLPTDPIFTLLFSAPVNTTTATTAVQLSSNAGQINTTLDFLNDNKTINVQPVGALSQSTTYKLTITDQLQGVNGAAFTTLEITFKTVAGSLQLVATRINNETITTARATGVPVTNVQVEYDFTVPLDPTTVNNTTFRVTGPTVVAVSVQLLNDNKTVRLTSTSTLQYLKRYTATISNALKGVEGQSYAGAQREFYTVFDTTPKFPTISDEELLTLVQQQTFKYFWDFAHPASGMARERNTSGDLVTSGGSGFGLMSIIVGIERGFITRTQGIERFDKILDFLETADRFHGAWSHWINGNTGKVIAFSANDNGGDLVETAFLVQGLLTVRQYLNAGNATENQLISRINTLYRGVEWDWYRRENQNVMYWHWSPDKGWTMNLPIRGWNEALMVYVLAAASPTHTIPKIVYDNGWANNGGIRNGNVYEGITLPLGYPFGGPLFLSQYSFLSLNPHNLADAYCTDYFNQNRSHSLINYNYCIRNPRGYVGYSSSNWGLTASDNHQGYNAHSPTNDLGVITPTAALSAFPYTPTESMEALKFFYYTLGDKLWGPYGFYDAFNITEDWYANSFLAIDQGPIIIMIENHRTGLLWNLFMSAPEVQAGLTKLGFTY
ncbi:MAG: Ig-like domain-containing protein [Cyclobacteriaceae bacterium]|nr:Ig-like domain-containing protein [Cyclobacteriaceae bacterium]